MMRTRRHALGQNFLHHKPTIEKIVATVAAEMKTAERAPCSLLEIGPGKLALTRVLSPLASELKLPFYLVERDRYLEEEIRAGAPDTELHFMDAATELLPELIDSMRKKTLTPLFVASNLPYSASSQILANLCHCSNDLSGAVVMVQKELAQRMAAPAGEPERGALSLLIQSYFEVHVAFDVGPGAFTPPPKVQSTVLKLRPLALPLTQGLREPLKFEHFCKMLFSHRRKMIRNMVPNEKHELFPKLGISGTERPETLKLETVLGLYRGISGEGI
ncbi:MAG: ribosomal RNA small subunit methyltransferase A [Deltaproteobacteria bacterium]|nr:ribosomal RNA small subunit methyltransferase A [Deltaproteobacteria bacterium]